MSVATLEHAGSHDPCLTSRLLVATHDPSTRAWRAVGFLSEEPDGWSFHYVKRVVGEAGFTPLFGFDDATRAYHSPRLFPLFAHD